MKYSLLQRLHCLDSNFPAHAHHLYPILIYLLQLPYLANLIKVSSKPTNGTIII